MKTSYIKNILLIAVLLVTASCEEYLEEIPNNSLPTDAAITDLGTARAAIIGAYDRVQGYYASSYPTLGTITTDNVVFNGTLSEYLQLDQNAVPTDNVITVAAYQGIYRAINSANSVIAYVPGIQDVRLTVDEKNKILGEAYFIRALGYFDLARGWGGVQLQLKPTTDLTVLKGIKRSTLEQTYDQVLADLIQAEQLLPEDATTRNRAQKSAARALRARLHLYRKQWADAENYATQVISNTKYTLLKPYKSFFTAPFQTAESVLELAYSANDRNTYWSLWYPSSAGGQYTLKPSDALVDKLNNPEIGGTRNSLIAGAGSSFYGVLYNTTATGTDPSYLIRIAELYLIRAESRARQNKLTEAVADLNAVRNRADLANTTATTQAQILQAIEDENGVEFAFEAHRWFDLVRTERAGAVLGLTNRNYWLFPIPYSDILSDPEVVQNPGY
ncbi:RagB/SusD family nutrient uptake outer membrane protein [Arcticibacter tournemirensis]|uniref:RagB/SusD family nutrient uptake outer membrane protein n=1 Tax=Arcticibacter tournemirensis TaxID=699437 RepID=A0A4V1KIM0_9SPHI|nr:RagB/SusD family nutrient uptake outer membrane protein [Arcticibacter tournemirensis]RXF71162.1 RagB/SusD family nutrient uptake outer membrane protein [Arcticibacter tournemirensis]